MYYYNKIILKHEIYILKNFRIHYDPYTKLNGPFYVLCMYIIFVYMSNKFVYMATQYGHSMNNSFRQNTGFLSINCFIFGSFRWPYIHREIYLRTFVTDPTLPSYQRPYAPYTFVYNITDMSLCSATSSTKQFAQHLTSNFLLWPCITYKLPSICPVFFLCQPDEVDCLALTI